MKIILPFAFAAAVLAVAPASAQMTQSRTVVRTTTVQRHHETVRPVVVRHAAVTTRRHRSCHWTWRHHRHVKVCRTVRVRTHL